MISSYHKKREKTQIRTKFEILNWSKCMLRTINRSFYTVYLRATVLSPPPLWFWSYWYHFFIESWDFLHKKSFAEEIIKSAGSRRGRQFFSAPSSVSLLITAHFEIVETELDFRKKFEIKSSHIVTNFFNLYIFFIPSRSPQNHPHFDFFFELLPKLKITLRNIFWYVVEQDTSNFFQLIPGGLTYIFPLEIPQKRW